MKLTAYILKNDTGFAPNPFGGYCTLACCKPTIRREAAKDDIVVGTTSKSVFGKSNHLIYAMQVDRILTFDEYWSNVEFANRKPTLNSAESRRGDNIWHSTDGTWKVVEGAFHDERALKRDTGGEKVLIAKEFYYFGRDAVEIPSDFECLLAKTQGHKNTGDGNEIRAFWEWIKSQSAPRMGQIGEPFVFGETECPMQCEENEEEEFEEV